MKITDLSDLFRRRRNVKHCTSVWMAKGKITYGMKLASFEYEDFVQFCQCNFGQTPKSNSTDFVFSRLQNQISGSEYHSSRYTISSNQRNSQYVAFLDWNTGGKIYRLF
jgi:hypothetical protein